MTGSLMNALTFSTFGGPEVLEYKLVPMPTEKQSEVLIKMESIGLNFADIYRRKGNYHLKGKPPYIAGYEGAGVVVSSQIEKYKLGQRVAFADVPFAHADYVVAPEAHVIPLPDEISFDTAAASLLQGLTAQYLVEDSFKVHSNHIVLVHAAAGGVGQWLIQMCKLKKANVIGLSRDEGKLSIIENLGGTALLLNEEWRSRLKALTNEKGADVVYDSVGSTLMDSLNATKEKGTVVFYGMSGGDPAPVDPRYLMDTSKTLTGGDLWSYLTSAEERISRASKLFDLLSSGQIILKEPTLFSLQDGAAAHKFLEEGKSSGKVLLRP